MNTPIRRNRRPFDHITSFRPLLELLEARELLASDFGDAPLPYPTLLAEGGAEHAADGPTLGAHRDAESNGVHSAGADGDDLAGSPDDEDGATFGTIKAGQVGATVAVNVQGGSAKLDAWIDFNGDGAWGGAFEQIADQVSVIIGDNTITFDVPGWSVAGTTYARFRLSTAGNLGPSGLAGDGEVEDHAVTIQSPKAACGCFTTHGVTTSVDSPLSVFAADVDGDGDTDALSASRADDKIAWHENDGSQNFTSYTISTAADVAQGVFAADVDGDGDMDVLSASYVDDKIAWYENNGSQTFTSHTISTASDGATSVYAADVDDDGDMDVLSSSFQDDEIAWYENNGSQTFSRHIISAGADRARDVFAADVDGDGDMDVLSASHYGNEIAWYENDGSESFTPHTINTDSFGFWRVFAADMDGDGDIDVLSANPYDHKISWYENDGSQNFTTHTVYSSAQTAPRSLFVADIDGDNDMDVLSAAGYDNEVAWHENDGSQNFTKTLVTLSQDAYAVFPADMDNDGDLDVLSASLGHNKVEWSENLRPKPKMSGGLDDVPRDPVPFVPPLPAPPNRPTSHPAMIAPRGVPADPESEALDAPTYPPTVSRTSAIKRLSDVNWNDVLHDDLPLFSEW